MNINQIRALPDSLVLSGLKTRVLKERENMTEVLEFLREVDRRRLYAESSHPSLWSFCTVELKYSAGAASRRIEAMRLLRDLPELKEDLVAGKQNLSSLAMAQNFFRAEEKNQEEKLTPEKKQEVFKESKGVFLSVLPVFQVEGYEENVQVLKFHLLNETNMAYRFLFQVWLRNKLELEIRNDAAGSLRDDLSFSSTISDY